MKKNNLIVPEGTRDLIFDECAVKREVESRFKRLFESRGYSEVITPGIEFYDVFTGKARYFQQEQLYKLVDSKNRLLVLRADNTLPIARLVATRYRESIFPLKVFYNQNIFLANPKNSGKDDEISQCGIEIIGGDIRKSDIEALSIAVEAMKASACGNFRFEIGNSQIFDGLVKLLEISEDEIEEIRAVIDGKNYPALNSILDDYGQNEVTSALRVLPSLFGDGGVFEKAEKLMQWKFAQEAIEMLKNTFLFLEGLGISNQITVDFGLVSRKNYYTGLIFKAYAENYGSPILSGGRYDNLISDFGFSVPAVGFGLNIGAICMIELSKSSRAKVKVPDAIVFSENEMDADIILYCNNLANKDFIVENSVLPTLEQTLEYAKRRGIAQVHIMDRNKVQVLEIEE
ncbi:MAG: ATP phosphoribosyltransferase regulatory subunit [Clostridiales bacterium]|nr:ATP phosphoribosyltransferase regulatory subunit [Clostridiales bacterium]